MTSFYILYCSSKVVPPAFLPTISLWVRRLRKCFESINWFSFSCVSSQFYGHPLKSNCQVVGQILKGQKYLNQQTFLMHSSPSSGHIGGSVTCKITFLGENILLLLMKKGRVILFTLIIKSDGENSLLYPPVVICCSQEQNRIKLYNADWKYQIVALS